MLFKTPWPFSSLYRWKLPSSSISSCLSSTSSSTPTLLCRSSVLWWWSAIILIHSIRQSYASSILGHLLIHHSVLPLLLLTEMLSSPSPPPPQTGDCSPGGWWLKGATHLRGPLSPLFYCSNTAEVLPRAVSSNKNDGSSAIWIKSFFISFAVVGPDGQPLDSAISYFHTVSRWRDKNILYGFGWSPRNKNIANFNLPLPHVITAIHKSQRPPHYLCHHHHNHRRAVDIVVIISRITSKPVSRREQGSTRTRRWVEHKRTGLCFSS